MANENKKKSAVDIEEFSNEMVFLLDRAIKDDNVTFENPNLIVCWEKKECKKDDCPIYNQKEELRCWQVAGTYCGGNIQGQFADKYQNCMQCDVYKAACPTNAERIGEGVNNLLYLIRKKTHHAEEQMAKITHLNKELSSALENLDNKNRQIQELVITDKLTKLYNRNYLFSTLEDEISRCARYDYKFSILMMDIDNFKVINDTYGHLAGDEILSFLGAMLKEKLRPTDRAFRFGGEEFVIVLPDTEATISYIVAERIRAAFECKTFSFTSDTDTKPATISNTLSIGITGYEKGMSIQKLLDEADEAMYKAKSLGKNRVVRHDELGTLE
ncbi:MAG TPA: GGDEF domain-containing protein [Nitrospirae bacterium]|nr:response regulator PleD [bacterium BMS3Abin09]GBE41343.1 response regulator PleD [bacterium BMS3Bbin09]HDH34575.1 GGDEF domain-containing protein [Nitrospirota bacterium]HDZ83647.1 GGDEF domain-containing protein [Nitrospirota bacterium]